MFDDINQDINKQVIGTEKVWSFFLAFSDNDKIMLPTPNMRRQEVPPHIFEV